MKPTNLRLYVKQIEWLMESFCKLYHFTTILKFVKSGILKSILLYVWVYSSFELFYVDKKYLKNV
jgi:hypothetical protein